MKFDVVTIFPPMVQALLAEGVIGRAIERGLIDLAVHDLREFASDRHRSVDDVPYGGGPGMVMKPEPFMKAVEHIQNERGIPDAVILTSPQGKLLTHDEADRLSRLQHIVVLCGRYEGVDERICEYVASEELSIGNYVLSGGELPASVIMDAVGRLVPGVVGDSKSVLDDSFVRSLLDCPHYTRPATLGEHEVPEVLLSGNHSEIKRWRKREAVKRTMERRPGLLRREVLDDEEYRIVLELQQLQDKRKAETGV